MRAIGMTGKKLPKLSVEKLEAKVAELIEKNEKLEAKVAELTKKSSKEDKKTAKEDKTPVAAEDQKDKDSK